MNSLIEELVNKEAEEFLLTYNPLETDFGTPDDVIFKDKFVTVRKDRNCLDCSKLLVKGTRARSLVAKFDGELMTYTWCVSCCYAAINNYMKNIEEDEDE